MVEHDKDNEMDDLTLNQILGLASNPALSSGFDDRLMAVLEREKHTSATIIPFPRRKAPSPWLMGVPLAACLMLGVFLGASGQFSDLLPGVASSTLTASVDQPSPSGVDDIETLSPGDLS